MRLTATDRLYAGKYYCEVAEVEVYLAGQQGVKLTWTAPGDNGNAGTAASYDVRYRVGSAIDGTNWNDANTKIISTGVPRPASQGTAQTMNVSLTGIASGSTVYYAIVAKDEANNPSPVSNSPSIVTP